MRNFFQLAANGLGYEQLRGLARTFASTRQAENSTGIFRISPKLAIVYSHCWQQYFLHFFHSEITGVCPINSSLFRALTINLATFFRLIVSFGFGLLL